MICQRICKHKYSYTYTYVYTLWYVSKCTYMCTYTQLGTMVSWHLIYICTAGGSFGACSITSDAWWRADATRFAVLTCAVPDTALCAALYTVAHCHAMTHSHMSQHTLTHSILFFDDVQKILALSTQYTSIHTWSFFHCLPHYISVIWFTVFVFVCEWSRLKWIFL